MKREEFQEYIDCFNRRDYDAAVRYFAEDVELQYFTRFANEPQEYRTRYGPAGFREHYAALHGKIDEQLEVKTYLSDGRNIFVSIYTEFRALMDADFTAGPMKKGEIFACTNFIVYDLDGQGKFKRIRVAHWAVHEPKPTESVLR
ncbi:MAG: nuclear transport factor 2 family protein [Clostridiales Family XIII bacterium]|jgi:hypothetical protein|nr:nuclear transport factor 2 family protein [Clostridiales Family XIII bacterium]